MAVARGNHQSAGVGGDDDVDGGVGDDDDADDEGSVSIETGPPGFDQRGEPLPQGHRRHSAGETPQSALGEHLPPTSCRPLPVYRGAPRCVSEDALYRLNTATAYQASDGPTGSPGHLLVQQG